MLISSEKFHRSPLGKWVSSSLYKLRAMPKSKKPKRPRPTFNWPSSSFATMELPTQLKQVFSFIDSNGDGKVSPLELGELLRSLGHDDSTSAREADGIVRGVDRNGDGFIDLDEFMQVVGEEPERGGDEDLEEAFRVFDTDGNGFISARELQSVLVGLGHGGCSVEDCRHMIRGVDKNGDGVVDFEEFRSMMASGDVVFRD